MKITEIILGVLSILVIALKLFTIPGASFLIVIILTFFSLYYFVFGFARFNGIKFRNLFKKDSYQNTNVKRIIGASGLGFSLSYLLIGVVFKLLLWPGSDVLLLSALVMLAIIFIVGLLFYLRNKTEYYTRIFKRVVLFSAIGVSLYMIPQNTLVDIYYRKYPEFAEQFKKVLDDPQNIEKREKLEKLRIEMVEEMVKKE